jgi:hypothetical protein
VSFLEDPSDVELGLAAVLSPTADFGRPGRLAESINATLSRLDPADRESVGDFLGSVGNTLKKSGIRDVAGDVIPIAATVVGGAYGGPVGAAIGGSVGGALGHAVSGSKPAAASQAQAPSPAQPLPSDPLSGSATTAGAAQPMATGVDAGGSMAAAQLLGLLKDPALVTSLLSLVMGQNGRSTVPVQGGAGEVPVGAMVNLLGVLANRVSTDAEDILMRREAAPAYLLDDTGCVSCDPHSPVARADALLSYFARTRQVTESLRREQSAAVEDAGDDDWWSYTERS